MWDFNLTQTSYTLYAIANYKHGKGDWTEFFKDLKILQTVPRLLTTRIEKSQSVSNVLNTIIKLGNVFIADGLGRLLFIITPEDLYSDLKTILLYIKRLPNDIPEVNLNEIEINKILYEELIKL